MPTKTRPRLTAQSRPRNARKSELHTLRRDGQVPGTLFGHGEPQMLSVPARSLDAYLLHHAPGALLDVELDGKTTPVLLRELDRDPVTGKAVHLGFQRVDLAENIRASIPLFFTGDEALVANGLVPQHLLTELEVHGRADQIPESITVDLSAIEAGHSVRISDLQLPAGMEVTREADTVVATVTTPHLPADVEAALDAEEAAHAEIVAAHGGEDRDIEGGHGGDGDGEHPASPGNTSVPTARST